MHNRETWRLEDGVGIEKILNTPATRRGLLRGAAGFGAGALAFSVGSKVTDVDARSWQAPTTANQHSADVALSWFALALQLMPTTPGLSPLPAMRVFGYLGVVLYESLIGGMPERESLAGQLNGLTAVPGRANRAYHWPSVANGALATSMRELFRMTTEDNLAAIENLDTVLAAQLRERSHPGIGQKSAARGRRVARHIMDWAATDGAHDAHLANFPEDYTPPVGDGLWVPTPPAFMGSYQPYWGTYRPMALSSVEDYDPGPPPEFSTDPGSEFHAAERHVYDTVNNATDEQLSIARHWANPVGHHQSLVMQAVAATNADLETAAVAFARGGIAVNDSIIACFHTKYRYSMIRPVSYIQAYIDPEWPNPPVATPPHPDYTAAHSVVTRAMARAMFDQFGDITFTDHTWDAVGLPPRTYDSWFGLSEENGLSRLYGGIHTRPAIEVGWDQGDAIGQAVSAVIDQAVA